MFYCWIRLLSESLCPPSVCWKPSNPGWRAVTAYTTRFVNPSVCLAFDAFAIQKCGIMWDMQRLVCALIRLVQQEARWHSSYVTACDRLSNRFLLMSVPCLPAGWTGSSCSASRRFSTPRLPGSSPKRESSEWREDAHARWPAPQLQECDSAGWKVTGLIARVSLRGNKVLLNQMTGSALLEGA